MKVKLIVVGKNAEISLSIPKVYVEELGWKSGDLLQVDIPMTGNGIIIFKET